MSVPSSSEPRLRPLSTAVSCRRFRLRQMPSCEELASGVTRAVASQLLSTKAESSREQARGTQAYKTCDADAAVDIARLLQAWSPMPAVDC